MRPGTQFDLSVLGERWRARARGFMADAERATRYTDVVRLTAMASTLEWAATDLSMCASAESSGVPMLTASRRNE